jgi:hypothetical protein
MQQTPPLLPPPYQDADWVRLPSAGRTGKPAGRLRGLSRTTLLELDEMGLIKVAAIRKPGAAKAIRLVFIPSLDAYLHKLATESAHDSCFPTQKAKAAAPKKQPARRKFP